MQPPSASGSDLNHVVRQRQGRGQARAFDAEQIDQSRHAMGLRALHDDFRTAA